MERRSSSPDEDVVRFEIPVENLLGVLAAHDDGVIYRDLNPKNIFVTDREPLTVKILDFGLAKLIETKQEDLITTTGMVMGAAAV